MPLHLLHLNFDRVEGFREQLGFLHDRYGHAAAGIRIRQLGNALLSSLW
jgi:hypothetical protein